MVFKAKRKDRYRKQRRLKRLGEFISSELRAFREFRTTNKINVFIGEGYDYLALQRRLFNR